MGKTFITPKLRMRLICRCGVSVGVYFVCNLDGFFALCHVITLILKLSNIIIN